MSHSVVDETVMSREEAEVIFKEICRDLISHSHKEWLTLKEMSEVTGKSLHQIELLITTNKIHRIKEIQEDGHDRWHIHRDMIPQIITASGIIDTQYHILPDREGAGDIESSSASEVGSISLEIYERRREEWMRERDRLIQGIMMYRYKFEELDRQLRLLPAPPEMMNRKLEEKNAQLQKAKNIILRERAVMKELASRVDRKEGHILKAQDLIRKEREEKEEVRSLLEEKEMSIAEKIELLHEAHRVIQNELVSKEKMSSLINEQEAALSGLMQQLEEEERAKAEMRKQLDEALAMATMPWWKRLFGSQRKK